jgi:3-carboxy-cis,cis-muconate cycloisomerase
MAFSALDSRLLGPLFATEEMRSAFSDRARLAAMIEAEAALARAQARFGIVSAALADALATIDVDNLDIGDLGAGTALAGVPTIPFVKAVQARIPNELEPSFHKGATTQDIADTGLVLQMRQGLMLIGSDLAAVIRALSQLAVRHRTTPCVGRTYGQHAAPITFGYKAAIWCASIAEVGDQLPTLRSRVLTASLGGPVGTLAGLGKDGPAVAAAYADELGLGTAPLAWHARRARMVEAGVWLAVLIGALGKMATDVADLASTEVGEVAEPYTPGRGGSSAMPHKHNPVSATVIIAAHTAAKGHVTTLIDAMAVAHERPAGAWHGEWHSLPQLFGLASGALHEAKILAEGLVVDAARMRLNLDATRGLLFADAVAARLAPRLGRAAAHELIEQAAKKVRVSGLSLQDVLAQDPQIAASGAKADIAAAFDFGPAVEAAAHWVDRAVEEADRTLERLPAAVDGSPPGKQRDLGGSTSRRSVADAAN